MNYLTLKAKRAVFLLLLCLSSWVVAQPISDEHCRSQANLFIEHLFSGRYDEAVGQFSGQLAIEVSALQLKDMWAQLQELYGICGDTGVQFVSEFKENKVVYTTMQFKKMPMYMKLVFVPKGNIGGIFFEPAPRKDVYSAPKYVDYNRVKELRLSLVNDSIELPARLTVPKTMGPHPVLVLVHGSGPQDMDETNGPNKPFRDLAFGLATRGIAVLRYDKRTKVMQKAPNTSFDIHDEVTNDALAAIEMLKTMPEVDSQRIFLLGHSLGGMMAPEIARRSGELSGLILLAAPARPLSTLLRIQLEALKSKAVLQNDTTQVEALEELLAKTANTLPENLEVDMTAKELPFNTFPPYWQSINAYNQLEVAKALSMPIYVVQAEKDAQVFKEDDLLWRAELKSNENVQFNTFEGLNHQFIQQKHTDVNKDYEEKGNVAEEVVVELARWISEIE